MKASNLKSFALGAGLAIAALGVYALAATLTTFASGDVVSSQKINDNFANLNADINAVNTKATQTAAKVKDAPGVAQAKTGSIGVSSTIKELASQTLTAPGPGYVLAIASAFVCFSHKAGEETLIDFGIASVPLTQTKDGTLTEAGVGAGVAAGGYCQSVSVQFVFPVTAQGDKTIRAWGVDATDGVGGAPTFSRVVLSVMYFPTAYGTVAQ